jgi:DNA-binding MarR family transcriptional regulator
MNLIRRYVRRLMITVFAIDGVEYVNDKKSAIKESELCLMYALDDDRPHSQKQIAGEWLIPKTTLNTIVKQWEREGLLTLAEIPGKRREMQICLTETGKERARASLAYIYEAEEKAMAKTLERYPPSFIEAMEYFSTALQEAFENQDPREKGNT